MEDQVKFLKEIIDKEQNIGYEYNYNDLFPMHSLSSYFVMFIRPLNEEIESLLKENVKMSDIEEKFDMNKIIQKGQETGSDLINFIEAFTEQWSIEAKEKLGVKYIFKDKEIFSTKYLSDFKLNKLSLYFEEVFYDFDFRKSEMEKINETDENEFLIKIYKEYYQEFENIYKEAQVKINHLYDFLKENKILNDCLAKQYHKNKKIEGEDSLSNFIKNKQFSQECEYEIKMSKSQGIQKVSIFKDGSFLVKDSDDNEWVPDFNAENYINLSKEIAEKYLDYFLRKKPTIKNIFIEQLRKENHNIVGAYKAAKNYTQYENILKNEKVNMSKLFEKEHASFEKIDDLIQAKIYENNVKKLASSIVSKKYAHLYNKQSYKMFKLLYDVKVTKEDLESNIGTKLAGFRNPEDLNQALSRYYNSLNEFDMESILKKAKGFNMEIACQKENYLILKIDDYQASSNLGSGSWCISRDDYYFNMYTKNKKQQFFVYDFEKNAEDNDSMIGITLTKEGDVNTGHYKNDNFIDDEELKKEIAEMIIKEKPNWFEPTAINKFTNYISKNRFC